MVCFLLGFFLGGGQNYPPPFPVEKQKKKKAGPPPFSEILDPPLNTNMYVMTWHNGQQ